MKKILSAVLLFSLAQITSAQVLGGGLTGSGTRMLQVNSSGELTPLTPGTSSQVLFGNGTWGSLPSDLWSPSGSNIFFNTGNVGIGTNSPGFLLDVNGNTRISGTLTGGATTVSSFTSSGSARFSSDLNVVGTTTLTGAVTAGTVSVSSLVSTGNISTGGTVGTGQALSFHDGVGSITHHNATVSQPAYFNLNTNAAISGNVNISGLGGSNSPGNFVYVDSLGNLQRPIGGGSTIGHCTTTTPWMIGGNNLGLIINAVIGTCNNADFVLEANNTPYIWLKPNGLLGIGDGNSSPAASVDVLTTLSNTSPFKITNTTMPTGGTYAQTPFEVTSNGQVFIGATRPTSAPYTSSILSVAGTITSQELFVIPTTGWADYVFKKGYALMPLQEVEKYITANQHLPNIPSANEIENNGQSIGKLQVLQMEKIEELTLYMIEIKKENEKLKQEIEKLKTGINESKK